jgi:hypothetical protein
MADKKLNLETIVKEILEETLNDLSHYRIIVLIDENDFPNSAMLNEGIWEPSSENGYMQRVDQPHFDWQFLHVDIASKKHINTKTKQVSWNNDGTRHDRQSFNDNFTGMEKAKRIARNALGLPDDLQLETINFPTSKMDLILERVEYIPTKASIFIFYAQNPNNPQLLFS